MLINKKVASSRIQKIIGGKLMNKFNDIEVIINNKRYTL